MLLLATSAAGQSATTSVGIGELGLRIELPESFLLKDPGQENVLMHAQSAGGDALVQAIRGADDATVDRLAIDYEKRMREAFTSWETAEQSVEVLPIGRVLYRRYRVSHGEGQLSVAAVFVVDGLNRLVLHAITDGRDAAEVRRWLLSLRSIEPGRTSDGVSPSPIGKTGHTITPPPHWRVRQGEGGKLLEIAAPMGDALIEVAAVEIDPDSPETIVDLMADTIEQRLTGGQTPMWKRTDAQAERDGKISSRFRQFQGAISETPYDVYVMVRRSEGYVFSVNAVYPASARDTLLPLIEPAFRSVRPATQAAVSDNATEDAATSGEDESTNAGGAEDDEATGLVTDAGDDAATEGRVEASGEVDAPANDVAAYLNDATDAGDTGATESATAGTTDDDPDLAPMLNDYHWQVVSVAGFEPRFEIPQKWSIAPQDNMVTMHGRAGTSAGALTIALQRLSRKPGGPHATLETSVAQALTMIRNTPSAELLRQERIELDGGPARFVELSFYRKGQPHQLMQVIFQTRQQTYWLGYAGPSEVYRRYRPFFDHTLETLSRAGATGSDLGASKPLMPERSPTLPARGGLPPSDEVRAAMGRYRVYVEPTTNVQFEVPSDWRKSEQDHVLTFASPVTNHDARAGVMSINFQARSQSLSELLPRFRAWIEGKEDSRILEEGAFRLAGMPAHRAVVTMSMPEGRFRFRYVFYEHGDGVGMLSFAAPPERFDELSEHADHLLRSLRRAD